MKSLYFHAYNFKEMLADEFDYVDTFGTPIYFGLSGWKYF